MQLFRRDFWLPITGWLTALLLVALSGSCTTTRVKRYQNLLDPLIGSSKRTEVNHLLGTPVFCRPEGDRELCEYRTSAARNFTVPDMHRKAEAMGPDLSPYDQFDVLHVYYDGFDTFKEWEPFVIIE